MIDQVTVFLENRAGRLAALSRTVADAGVDMYALTIADTADYGLVRIVCSNRQFKEITPPPHRDGMFYHEHMPRNIRFEDFCYHSAVLGEAGHVYVEYPTGWIDQQTLPMHSDDESVGYCLFSFELTESADSKRLASVSVDAAQFAVTDISKTTYCPLARVMRRELKKRGIEHVKVVYSTEPPLTPAPLEEETGRRATPGSVAFVPAVAGLVLAGEVVKDLIRE